jgi:hypothetical protein
LPTLKEQMAQLVGLKHRLAVWEALAALMDDGFVSKDDRKASRAIRVPDCSIEVVPEDTIEDVIRTIGEGPIAELRDQISTIENQQVVVLGGSENGPEQKA